MVAVSASSSAGDIPAQESLPDFDLSYVRQRVAREHPDWSQERLNTAESDYRLFLARCKAPHEDPLAPAPDADEFWHAHILHTRDYARDSQNYFGHFLHHKPTTGVDCIREPGDEGACSEACSATPDNEHPKRTKCWDE